MLAVFKLNLLLSVLQVATETPQLRRNPLRMTEYLQLGLEEVQS